MTTHSLQPTADAWVDSAYAVLAKNPEFTVREAQVELSKRVVQAMLTAAPLVAEAPTGTGKTLAYLIGALASASVLRAQGMAVQPMLVSTATKALQSQLFEKDLPTLVAAGLLRSGDAVLAKGKGNYMCVVQTEEVLETLGQGSLQDVYIDDALADLNYDQVRDMLYAAEDGTWDGDFDTYKGPRPKKVIPLAVSSNTCTGKKCPVYRDCSYYRARSKLAGAAIIVANHDLVLRDFLLRKEKVENPLPIAKVFVIFDEGHHLPEKAIKVGAREGDIARVQEALPKIGGIQRLLRGSPELTRLLAQHKVLEENFERKQLAAALEELSDLLETYQVEPETNQLRFRNGKTPEQLSIVATRLQAPLGEMLLQLEGLNTGLQAIHGETSGAVKEKAQDLGRRCLDIRMPLKALGECLTMLTGTTRRVKWLYRKDSALSLHCSPVEGADVLRPLLWNLEDIRGVAIVSATLRDVEGFTRYRESAGVPASATTMVLPFTFPYRDSKLTVAGMRYSPKAAERKLYLEELKCKLPTSIDPKEGTLLLFPSWAMLREMTPLITHQFGENAVFVQGSSPVTQLREAHAARINAGKGSILMGTATLAEGLDLPGKLCTHVAIMALPFAAPTDPVEQELAEMLGSDYFKRRSLPDAMVRLVQMVGRLLRRESDVGRITVFDRRLASMSYGQKMLQQLPPFQKVIEPIAA